MPYLSASISSVDLGSSDSSESRLIQSLSMPDVDHLTMKEVLGTIVASWGPNLLSRCLVSQAKAHKAKPTPFIVALKVLKSQVLKLKCRVRALEAEVADLKHECILARSDALEYRRELDALQYDYFNEIAQNRKYAISSREDKEKLKLLEYQVEQSERFLLAMVDLKLHQHVRYGAAQSILQGDDAENSLLDAILAASTRKSSPWARVIPAVVECHAPEKYLLATTLAPHSTQDICKRPHAIEIRNQNHPFNIDTITSSVSQISDVTLETLSESDHEEPSELLDVLKPVDTTKHIMSIVVTATQPTEEILQSTSLFKPLEFTSIVMEKSIFGVEIDNNFSQATNVDPFTSQNNDHVAIPHTDVDLARFSTETDALVIKSEVMDEPSDIYHLIITPSGTSNFSEPTERSPPNTPQKNINRKLSTPFLRAKSPEISPPVTPKKTTKFKETRIKTPITARRIRAPTTPTGSLLPSSSCKLLASSPIKNFGSTVPTSPRTPVSPSRPLKVHSVTSPIRSRLSTPKTKRPVLRSINFNTPTITVEQAIIKPEINSTPKQPAERNSTKPSAKALGKRRGVIMINRDLLPGKTTVAPTTTTKISPAIDEHDTKSQFDSDADICSDTRKVKVVDSENIDDTNAFDHELEPTLMDPFFKPNPQLPSSSSHAQAAFAAEERQPTSIYTKSNLESLVDRLAMKSSDSDLGSLEMTNSEDESDCEHLRIRMEQVDDINDAHQDLKTLSHICKLLDDFAGISSSGGTTDNDLEAEDSFCADDETGPIAMDTSAASVARPSSPFIRPLAWARSVSDAPVTSESSSSLASSDSSYSVDSPIASSLPSKFPLSRPNSRASRCSTKSPTPVKKANATPLINSTSRPVIRSGMPLPTKIATSKLPTPPHLARGPTVTPWPVPQNVVVDVLTTPSRPTGTPNKSTSPSQKGSLHLLHSKARPNMPMPTPSSKTWTGRGIFTPIKPSPAYPAAPSPSQTKLRATTVNALSPLPPALSTPSLTTLTAAIKPRSNTINTYSPINRSPLSQHVINSSSTESLIDSPKSRLAQPSTPKKTQLQPKSALFSRMNIPISIPTKTTLPLRILKKAPVKTHRYGTYEPGLEPPIAAFMRPAVDPASTSTRRMTNSIAPLIPNWTPTSQDGILSPTECRNMFRNSLSMVVR